MYTVCILSPNEAPSPELMQCLEQEDVACIVGPDAQGGPDQSSGGVPDLVLLEMAPADDEAAQLLVEQGRALRVPLMAVLSAERLAGFDFSVGADDFIVFPWWSGELTARVRQLLERQHKTTDAPGVIRAGDLVIDPNRYDVYLAGRKVLLTFKEYELLKLLAANPGHVYSRDRLLDQVWGYQYFGGTRTVDVHVRRLRSKIEDATHTFIETVRNVGYRFQG